MTDEVKRWQWTGVGMREGELLRSVKNMPRMPYQGHRDFVLASDYDAATGRLKESVSLYADQAEQDEAEIDHLKAQLAERDALIEQLVPALETAAGFFPPGYGREDEAAAEFFSVMDALERAKAVASARPASGEEQGG